MPIQLVCTSFVAPLRLRRWIYCQGIYQEFFLSLVCLDQILTIYSPRISAPIKRAADSKTVSLLVGDALNRKFRRQMLMDGLLSSMAIIATCSDDINPGEIIRTLELDPTEYENAEDFVLANRRNEEAKRLIRRNLLLDVSQLVHESGQYDLLNQPVLTQSGMQPTNLLSRVQLRSSKPKSKILQFSLWAPSILWG